MNYIFQPHTTFYSVFICVAFGCFLFIRPLCVYGIHHCLFLLHTISSWYYILVFSSILLFVTPWTIVSQAPLSKQFSRQEYWRRLPFPTPGDLLNPGIKLASPMSPALAGVFFTTSATYVTLFHPVADRDGVALGLQLWFVLARLTICEPTLLLSTFGPCYSLYVRWPQHTHPMLLSHRQSQANHHFSVLLCPCQHLLLQLTAWWIPDWSP